VTGADEWVGRVLRNKAAVFRSLWILQLLVGIFLLAVGYYMGRGHLDLIRAGARAPGQVVGHRQKQFVRSNWTSTSTTAFMPIVEFRAGSEVVRFTDWLGSSTTGRLPDRVTVLYDPATPSIAMIDRPVMNWIPWAPIAAVGGFLTLVGIGRMAKERAR
jgi:Protein of unknown function (DUF3592)